MKPRGGVAIIKADGKTIYAGAEEAYAFHNYKFSRWSYYIKRFFPQPHSCAKCHNRPIDFCTSNKRTYSAPEWIWKNGITNQQVHEAQVKDMLTGTRDNENALKIFRKCPLWSWTKVAPFYNRNCPAGEWE